MEFGRSFICEHCNKAVYKSAYHFCDQMQGRGGAGMTPDGTIYGISGFSHPRVSLIKPPRKSIMDYLAPHRHKIKG